MRKKGRRRQARQKKVAWVVFARFLYPVDSRLRNEALGNTQPSEGSWQRSRVDNNLEVAGTIHRSQRISMFSTLSASAPHGFFCIQPWLHVHTRRLGVVLDGRYSSSLPAPSLTSLWAWRRAQRLLGPCWVLQHGSCVAALGVATFF